MLDRTPPVAAGLRQFSLDGGSFGVPEGDELVIEWLAGGCCLRKFKLFNCERLEPHAVDGCLAEL